MAETDEPTTETTAPPADTPADPPKPEPAQYMTREDFKAAMDEWKAEQKAEREREREEEARRTPAPKPKPKPAAAAPAVEADTTGAPREESEEPRYGNRRWFNRK
jgi:hypothetical protein